VHPDFLRNIVNPALSKHVKVKEGLRNSVDEIRRLVFDAENKYKFSIYNGDPANLAKYLVSDDFKLVVDLFKSSEALEVLEEILLEAKTKYRDIPVVVEAVDKILEQVAKLKAKQSK